MANLHKRMKFHQNKINEFEAKHQELIYLYLLKLNCCFLCCKMYLKKPLSKCLSFLSYETAHGKSALAVG